MSGKEKFKQRCGACSSGSFFFFYVMFTRGHWFNVVGGVWAVPRTSRPPHRPFLWSIFLGFSLQMTADYLSGRRWDNQGRPGSLAEKLHMRKRPRTHGPMTHFSGCGQQRPLANSFFLAQRRCAAIVLRFCRVLCVRRKKRKRRKTKEILQGHERDRSDRNSSTHSLLGRTSAPDPFCVSPVAGRHPR